MFVGELAGLVYAVAASALGLEAALFAAQSASVIPNQTNYCISSHLVAKYDSSKILIFQAIDLLAKKWRASGLVRPDHKMV